MSGPPPPPPMAGFKGPALPIGKRVQLKAAAISIAGSTVGEAAAASSSNRGSAFYQLKSDTGFVGLGNQGATCYMNSLLQTLYMTPEFRLALYKWSYDKQKDPTEDRCIPLQLQGLFARLQIGDQSVVDTVKLTKSFGWQGHEAFEQQDVQELLRVLFDALEVAFRINKSANPVHPLYEGKMVDYIRCLECSNARTRVDSFQDVQVVIRDAPSLEQALYRFMEPEQLTGDNRWSCEQCGHKVDALKGLRFETAPRLLTMQLKRFDFDWNRRQRVKLHQKFTFPFVLDMTPFLPESTAKHVYDLFAVLVHSGGAHGGHYYCYLKSLENGKWYKFNDSVVTLASAEEVECTFGEDKEDEKKEAERKAKEEEEKKAKEKDGGKHAAGAGENTENIKSDANEAPKPPPAPPVKPAAAEDKPNPPVKLVAAAAVEGILKTKDAPKPEGPKCATAAVMEKLLKAKSEAKTAARTAWGSATAYMLVYRLQDAHPLPQVRETDIPIDLREAVSKENTEFAKERAEYKAKADMLIIKVLHKEEPAGFTISIDKHQPLSALQHTLPYNDDILKKVIPQYPGLDASCVRIRSWNTTSGTLGEVLGGNKLALTLDALNFFSYRAVYVETRKAGEEWPSDATSMAISIVSWDAEKKDVRPAVLTYVPRDSTLGQVKALIAPLVNIPVDLLRVLRVLSYEVQHLDGNERLLRSDLAVGEGATLHVEALDEKGQSPLLSRFEQEMNRIEIRFNLIDTHEYSQTMTVDKRKTIAELKELIGAIINVAVGQFKMKKSMFAKEFRQPELTLEKAELSDGSNVFVTRGIPLRLGEILCSFFVYEFDKGTFSPLCETPMDENIPLAELKKLMAEKMGTDAKLVRIREKTNSKPGKVLYMEDASLKANIAMVLSRGVQIGSGTAEAANEKTSLCLQKIPADENIGKNDLLIEAVQWHVVKNAMARKEEILLKDISNVRELRVTLSQRHPEIPLQFICCAKALKIQLADVETLGDLNWEVADDAHVGGVPWYLRDGDTIVFKDERDIDPDVLAALAACDELHVPGEGGAVARKLPPKNTRPVERGIHISVISREEQEQIIMAIEAENKKKKDEAEKKAADAAVASVAASLAAEVNSAFSAVAPSPSPQIPAAAPQVPEQKPS